MSQCDIFIIFRSSIGSFGKKFCECVNIKPLNILANFGSNKQKLKDLWQKANFCHFWCKQRLPHSRKQFPSELLTLQQNFQSCFKTKFLVYSHLKYLLQKVSKMIVLKLAICRLLLIGIY